jgi:hypothetical protein
MKQVIEQVLYSDPEQPHEQARVASTFEELSAHVKHGEHTRILPAARPD